MIVGFRALAFFFVRKNFTPAPFLLPSLPPSSTEGEEKEKEKEKGEGGGEEKVEGGEEGGREGEVGVADGE
jgi:hypothetical protein